MIDVVIKFSLCMILFAFTECLQGLLLTLKTILFYIYLLTYIPVFDDMACLIDPFVG